MLHCGWPSFDEALRGMIRYIEDRSHGTVRTEARCDSHLGHLVEGEHFTPKNARYCINSISMTLDPAKQNRRLWALWLDVGSR